MGAKGHVGAIALIGLDARYVRVEAAVTGGLPGTRIVGLPDAAVREAADRLQAACHRSGLGLPQARRVVNLSPGGLRKVGSGFDLPVALAVMVAAGHLAPADVEGVVAVGELGLDGSVRATPGTLPIVAAARDHGVPQVVVARDVAPEASLVDDVTVIGVGSLREAVEVLAGRQAARPADVPPAAGHRGRARPLRRPRPAAGPSGARGRRGRGPPPAHGGAAGMRQVDARAAAARAAAPPHAGRGARGRRRALGGRHARR